LFIIPTGKLKLSRYGSNSLYVYVWHGFFVKVFISFGLIGFMGQMNEFTVIFLSLIIAVIMTLLLSSQYVSENTQRVILKPIAKFGLNNV